MAVHYRLKVSDLARTAARAGDAAEGKKLGHARCVSQLAYTMAELVGLSPDVRQSVLLAGLFHDIGWIQLAKELARLGGSADAPLLQGHPCAPERDLELRPLLAEHVLVPDELMAPLGLPPALWDTVSLSHEHWDGSGVPDGLRGSEIPEPALLLAVADHAISLLDPLLDVETPPADALVDLDRFSGSRLKPSLVELARTILLDSHTWRRVADVEGYDGLVDEALYPLQGDFVDIDSPTMTAWLEVLGSIADHYHPDVQGHAARVSELSRVLAEEMGLSSEEAREIEIAAVLAELGRVGLPPPLVFRQGTYTADERLVLQAYPALGERIMAPIRGAVTIFEAAASHREKLNGTGYPQGLRGNEIPLGARVIAVADSFLALTSDRPERLAYAPSASLSILQGEAAKLFDGLVVDALESVVARDLRTAF
jgi:HD-GYP domain-containing protein (c-di-GMP phosphodiesterase class II)